MSNADAHSTITITIRGVSQSLEEAAAKAASSLGRMGQSAGTSDTRLRHMGEGAHAAEREMTGMAAGTRLASDALQLFDSKATGAYYQLMSLGGIAKEMGGSFGQLRAAVFGSVEAFAAMGAINFLSGSVTAAIEADTATQSLNAALAKTPGLAHAVNDEAERGAGAWARYGVSVSQLKGAVATGLGAGIKVDTLIGNPKTIADIAAALGTDVPTALHQITAGASSAQAVVAKLGLSMAQQNRLLLPMRWENGDQRLKAIMQAVEHSNFAGQGDAKARAAAGSFTALGASLKDLQETVGPAIVPALTAMAQALTGGLTAANQLLAGFGGLGTVLRNTWLPLVGLGVVMFTGLRSVVFDLAGKLIGTVVNAFGQTTQALVATEQEAIRAGDAMKGIPPETRTVAIFDSAAAVAVKEPYIANVRSVPTGTLTVAVFDATAAEASIADLSAYGAAHPVQVPVVYDASKPFVEASPVPIDVPVTYDTTRAFTEAAATPIDIPVHYDTTNALVETAPTPISVPVVYDTTNAFVEAAATPIDIPVRYDTTNAFTEVTPTAIDIPVRYDTTNALVEARPTPLVVPVSYDTAHALVEATPTAIDVPVRYDTTNAFVEATAHPLQIEATYDFTNAFHEATATPLTIPVRYDTTRAFAEAHATPIDIPVTYDYKNLLHEAVATPINIPVHYDTTNAFHEAHATPITVPVRYDTSNAFVEAHTTAIDVPVITHNVDQGKLNREIAAADAAAAAHPVNLPIVTHNVDESKIEAEIRTAQVYAAAHPVDVPVRTSGTVHVASGTGVIDIQPRLDARHAAEMAAIHSELQAEAGTVTVPVRPQWIANAGHLLGQSLAVGASIAITEAIFQSVKIDHIDAPTGKVAFTPADAARLASLEHALAGMKPPTITVPKQQHVYVDNIGPLGSGMAGGKPATLPVGTIPVRLMNAYDIGSTNNPIHMVAAASQAVHDSTTTYLKQQITALQNLQTDAKKYHDASLAYQKQTAGGLMLPGGLVVRIGSLDVGGVIGMAAAVTAGNIAASALVGLGGKLIPQLPILFRKLFGKGGEGDPPASGGASPVDTVLGETGKILTMVPKADVPDGSAAAKAVMVGVTHSLGTLDWGAYLRAVALPATLIMGLTLKFGGLILEAFAALGALLGGGGSGAPAMITLRTKLITSFSGVIADITSGLAGKFNDLKNAGGSLVSTLISGISTASKNQAGTAGHGFDVALNIVVQLANGVKASAALLIQAGKDMITGFINGMINLVNQALSHFPGGLSVPLLSTTPPKPPPTHHGATTAGSGHGASLLYVNPALAASLRGPAHPGAGLHHAQHTTTHQHAGTHQETHQYHITNQFHINGAQDPQAISHQITQAFLDLEDGVRSAARHGKHGR